MRGDSGVAGEGRVVGVPKFHSWDKCTMPLTNINSGWMSKASSGLCINLFIIIIYAGPLFRILVCNMDADSPRFAKDTPCRTTLYLFHRA